MVRVSTGEDHRKKGRVRGGNLIGTRTRVDGPFGGDGEPGSNRSKLPIVFGGMGREFVHLPWPSASPCSAANARRSKCNRQVAEAKFGTLEGERGLKRTVANATRASGQENEQVPVCGVREETIREKGVCHQPQCERRA